MAFKKLNDLKLIEEYCCKPVNVICPISKTCYDNEFQCKYWKQVWKRHSDDFYIIRQGGNWYKDKINDCEVEDEQL